MEGGEGGEKEGKIARYTRIDTSLERRVPEHISKLAVNIA